MKRNALIAAIAAGLFSAVALAQMGPMAGGYGQGMGGFFGGGSGGGGYGACAQSGAFEALGLTADQRQQIATIMDESATQRLALMDGMHDLRSQSVRNGSPDYTAMATLREQMVTLMRDRRDRIDAVLTPEQRAQMQGGFGPRRGFGPGR